MNYVSDWKVTDPLPTGNEGDYWIVKGDSYVELNGHKKHLSDDDWIMIENGKLAVAPKWSYSRISTFDACMLKYYYRYIMPYDPNQEDNEAAHKGTCFHETAEQMYSGRPTKEMEEILESKIQEYEVDRTKYTEDEALRRFLLFWPEYVTKKEAEGYTVQKEYNLKTNIDNHLYTGNLDLSLYRFEWSVPDNVRDRLVTAGKAESVISNNIPVIRIKPDYWFDDDIKALQNMRGCTNRSHIIIYDYKSPKSSSAASYKKQIVLYAYMVGQTQGWNSEQIYANIECYIFFPFSTQKHDNDFDNMMSSVKRVNYKPEDVDEIIKHDISIVRESDITPWDNINLEGLGTFAKFSCDYCPYRGTIPDKSNGFTGCKCTYDMGFRQARSLKFSLREGYEKKVKDDIK